MIAEDHRVTKIQVEDQEKEQSQILLGISGSHFGVLFYILL